jgi:hypothetical protein
VQVELCEGRLLLHQHHGAFPLLHMLKLGLLFTNLLAVLQLELVVPLKLLLSVTSLEV